MILLRKCEECTFEWEIEWDGLTLPVANGHTPDGFENEGQIWFWHLHHGNNDCVSPLIIDRAEFDNA